MKHVAILVCSVDSYADVWPAFFTLFFRYWPDIPCPVYLITNEIEYADKRVTSLKLGDDRDWSTTFKNALLKIKEERLVIIMEDYLLYKPIDTQRLQRFLDIMEREEAGCLRLYPDKKHFEPYKDYSEVAAIKKRTPFRVSLQAAFWRKDVLLKLVQPYENAWEFEVYGSKRSNQLAAPFLTVLPPPESTPFPYYCTGVVRGKWMPGAVKLCRKEGIVLDIKKRPIGWMRGFVRDVPIFLPMRILFVFIKRLMGIQ